MEEGETLVARTRTGEDGCTGHANDGHGYRRRCEGHRRWRCGRDLGISRALKKNREETLA